MKIFCSCEKCTVFPDHAYNNLIYILICFTTYPCPFLSIILIHLHLLSNCHCVWMIRFGLYQNENMSVIATCLKNSWHLFLISMISGLWIVPILYENYSKYSIRNFDFLSYHVRIMNCLIVTDKHESRSYLHDCDWRSGTICIYTIYGWTTSKGCINFAR